MRLSELLSPDRVRVPLRPGSRTDILRQLVELALTADDPAVGDVLEMVQEREAQLSTGIGGGVAIPHARSDAVPTLCLAAGRTAEPIDYNALDGTPVTLMFMLLAPEDDQGAHVKALSRIARLLRDRDVRERLASASDATTFIEILRQAERA